MENRENAKESNYIEVTKPVSDREDIPTWSTKLQNLKCDYIASPPPAFPSIISIFMAVGGADPVHTRISRTAVTTAMTSVSVPP